MKLRECMYVVSVLVLSQVAGNSLAYRFTGERAKGCRVNREFILKKHFLIFQT